MMVRWRTLHDGHGNIIGREPMPENPRRERRRVTLSRARSFMEQFRANPEGLSVADVATAVAALMEKTGLDEFQES